MADDKKLAKVDFQETSLDIWGSKYQLKDNEGNAIDKTIDDSYERIATALSKIEKPELVEKQKKSFLWALQNGAIPAGRITSNAGAEKHKPSTSLINCTVSGTIPDSMNGIMKLQHEAALTLKAGCVSADTLVITEKGLVTAKEAVEGKHKKILSYNTFTREYEEKNIEEHLTVVVKKSDNIKIEDEKGGVLETSKIHPVLIYRDNDLQYVEAENIDIDKDFLVDYKLSPKSVTQKDIDTAWFCGVHLGDGSAYIKNHNINKPKNWRKTLSEKGQRFIFKIRSAEKEVVEGYSKFFSMFCQSRAQVVENVTENGTLVYDYAVSSYEASKASELIDNQIGKKTKTFKIPEWIEANPEKYFIPFFAGLVDADGYVNKEGRFISLTSINENFLKEIKKMLSLFGVNSSIIKSAARSHKYNDKKIVGSGHYSLKISDIDFLHELSLFLKTSKKIENAQKGSLERGQYKNYYLTQFAKEFLMAKESELTHKEKGALGFYHKKHQQDIVSKIYVKKWARRFPEIEKELIFGGSLKRISKKSFNNELDSLFYDFKVEGNNNYLAGKNGFSVIHNCGIGYEFSTLRPKGAFVAGPGATTSGPLTFMDIYDAMCFTVASAGGRRGAQMGTFDISHPDVMDFIKAKHKDGRLRQFNLSLLITDQFIEAVKNDDDWPLVFPVSKNDVDVDKLDYDDPSQVVWREWPIHDKYIVNEEGLVACKVYKMIKAQNLWNMIMTSTYDYAEPGFILIDRVNDENNNWFCEAVRATNPCLTGDTLVETENGNVKLETVKVGDLIKTIDGYRPVKTVEVHEDVNVYSVHFSNGKTLKATAAHIFHTRKSENYEWDNDTRLDELEKNVHQVRVVSSGKEDFTYITKIEPAGKDKVYDLFEEVTDTWITEGIVSRGCGEQPLPPNGACLLGSVNLTQFVVNPFEENAYFDFDRYKKVVSIFTRMLDNVVEINNLPLKKQREEIIRKRRHGMGFLGLGSTLTMLRMKYGSDESLDFTEEVSKVMALEGWKTGLELAKEKGPAPIMDEDFTVTGEMLRKRPEMVEDGYKEGDTVKGRVLHIKYSRYMQKVTKELTKKEVNEMLKVGLRFTHHTSIAPTGTISLSLANNASNGIEPSFSHHYLRNVIKEGQNSKAQVDVFSYELLAYRKFIDATAMPFDKEKPLPEYFTTSDDVTPEQHVKIQAAAQRWIDSSISKTANVPTEYPFEDFKDIYMTAYEEGLKGCTTFRFYPEVFSGVLVKESDLENTMYRFELKNGEVVEVKGNQKVEYEGQVHVAANLFDALKDGYYGKY